MEINVLGLTSKQINEATDKHFPKMWDGNENKAAQDINSIGCLQMFSCSQVSYNGREP